MPLSTINNTLPYVVSMGEPSGIGPEIILKSWMARRVSDLPVFFVTGQKNIFQETANALGLNVPLEVISSPDEAAKIFSKALPIFDVGENTSFTLSRPSTATASLTLGAITTAVEFIFSQKTAGLITAPIQKSVLYQAGFTCPGHTEYLAELCLKHTAEFSLPIMMLVSEYLRVIPLTIHMPLRDVMAAITPDLIVETCEKIHHSLIQDFGISAPRIAVAGLNPHAGENETMGNEDSHIIAPALETLRQKGLDIQGPLPADTMFHARAREKYDAALCMYHDQALIPIKTLDFDGGVNVTVGLPLVRTSPDHGTALNIAGQNKANPTSMINAIKRADQISQNRQAYSHV